MVASLAGCVRVGSELDAPGGMSAAYFCLENGGTGFILARQHFHGAGWHEAA